MIYKEIELRHTKKARVECPKCGKFLVPYLDTSNYCQKCYREMLDRYSFWKYNERVPKPKIDTTAYRVCEILIGTQIKPKTLVDKYGEELGISSVKYVNNIKEKYLVRCDTFGNDKPDIGR